MNFFSFIYAIAGRMKCGKTVKVKTDRTRKIKYPRNVQDCETIFTVKVTFSNTFEANELKHTYLFVCRIGLHMSYQFSGKHCRGFDQGEPRRVKKLIIIFSTNNFWYCSILLRIIFFFWFLMK